MTRRRRWILRAVIGLFGLLLLCVVAALLILANLDAGPIKRLIQSQVRAQGVELDFADGAVTWGGVRLRDVRIASAAADTAVAPHLLSIAAIDGRWSPLAKRLDDLVIRDVVVTVIVDPDGTTSFDRWLAGLPPRPPPPVVPLSQTLEGLLPPGLAAKARIDGITLRILRRGPEGMLPLIVLSGIQAHAELGGGRAALALGPADATLTVGERAAVANVDGSVALAEREVRSRLALTLSRQEIAPELPRVEKLLDLAATVSFRPAEQRTAVKLERLALLDGAVRADASVDLLDAANGGARPIVRAATCRIDAVALARAVPQDLGPLVVEASEPVTCAIADLELTPAPKGKLSLAGRFSRLVYRDIEARGVGLEVEARPDLGAFTATLHLPIEQLKMPDLAVSGVDARLQVKREATAIGGFPLALGGSVAVAAVAMPGQAVRGASVTFEGTAHSARLVDLQAKIAADGVAAAAAARDVRLELTLAGLALAEPAIASTGKVGVHGTIGHLEQAQGPRADDLQVGVDLTLGGDRPSSGRLAIAAARLTVPGVDDLAGKPMTLGADLDDVVIDAAAPARSRGRAKLALAYGGASAGGVVEGSAADLRWDLTGKADRVGPAQALSFATKGSYGKTIAHQTTVDVGRVTTSGAALRAAHVTVDSSGTLRRQKGKIVAALDGLTVRGKAAGSPRLELTVDGDRDRPRLDLTLHGTQPDSDLTLFVDVEPGRTVRWKIDGKVTRLGALAPFLPDGPDWDKLGVRIKGSGHLSGVVRGVKGGVPILVADPALTARGKASLDLAVRDLGYRGAAETVADAGEITLRAEASLADTRTVSVDLAVPELAAVASGVHVAVAGLTARLDAVLEKSGRADGKIAVRIKHLKQSAFASYPVDDLVFDAQVNGDAKADLSFRASLDNAGAGTRFELTGQADQRVVPGLDVVPGRHALAVDGKIEQRLDSLTAAPELLRARGRISIPFRVESGDLVLFNTRGLVKLEGVSIELPASKIAVREVNGELPILEEIVRGPAGAEIVGRGELGVYPQLRFSDHQPFLGTTNYLSIVELTVGDKRMGPLAGNVRLDHDVLALDQLELAALGGKITGQCQIEVRGPDTRVAFRGKVTGVRPSSGEDRLDANAALTLLPYRMGLEGRVEIVTIGRRHLLDLLDVWDPFHADVSANRVRLGLKLGYPKQVRLKFLHGFASLAVELGGIASIVRIDEIQGIPIGPALARYLSPVLERTP